MIRSIGILVGVALAAMFAGIAAAFLLYYWWQRVQKRRQDVFSGKKQSNNIKTAQPVSVTQVKVGIVRPKAPEKEPLEILVENHKNTLVLENHRRSTVADIPQEAMMVNQKINPIEEKQNEFVKITEKHEERPQSEIVKELETNFTIASTPWSDKLLPFQTSSWDKTRGENEPLLVSHFQELISLYVDIGLANNIVWMATEIRHRSKELDETYMKLCMVIADRLRRLLSLRDKV